MLVCPKCGYDNPPGCIFCHSCGDKLDLSQVKAPTAAEKSRRQIKLDVGHAVRVISKLSIFGVVVLGGVLICLTPSVVPVVPTSGELIASGAKRIDLEKLVKYRQAGQVIVTEAELNTFLNRHLPAKPTGQGVEVIPVALRASFSTGTVKIEFLGTAHFGTFFDKNFYLSYAGQPVVTGGQFMFQPTGGWLGKLPIHPKILSMTPWIESYFAQLINGLTEEKMLLDKLTDIAVTKESLEFTKSATTIP